MVLTPAIFSSVVNLLGSKSGQLNFKGVSEKCSLLFSVRIRPPFHLGVQSSQFATLEGNARFQNKCLLQTDQGRRQQGHFNGRQSPALSEKERTQPCK